MADAKKPAQKLTLTDDLVGENKPAEDKTNFNGVVDNRRIPDANMPTEEATGVLDTSLEGHGLLRPNYKPSRDDIYISSSQIRRFHLRSGDMISGPARRPKNNEKYWGLLKVSKIEGQPIADFKTRPYFDQLTPIYPNEKLTLETDKEHHS